MNDWAVLRCKLGGHQYVEPEQRERTHEHRTVEGVLFYRVRETWRDLCIDCGRERIHEHYPYGKDWRRQDRYCRLMLIICYDGCEVCQRYCHPEAFETRGQKGQAA